MKRIIAIILMAAVVTVCFSACFASEAAKAVNDKIDAIGDVTLEKEALIADAEEAYAKLSDEDKKGAFVKKLEEARADFDALKSFSGEAEATMDVFEAALKKYGTTKSTVTESYKALSDKLSGCKKTLRAEYERIFEPVKAQNDEYLQIEADAGASAKAYIDNFKALNPDKTVDVRKIGAIAQKDSGTVYYLFAFTYNNGTEDVNVYSTVRFAGVPENKSFADYADSFYCSAPSSEKADALTMGNIEVELGVLN